MPQTWRPGNASGNKHVGCMRVPVIYIPSRLAIAENAQLKQIFSSVRNGFSADQADVNFPKGKRCQQYSAATGMCRLLHEEWLCEQKEELGWVKQSAAPGNTDHRFERDGVPAASRARRTRFD